MRSSRLLALLMLLQTRGRVSATVLAREFEVAVRTIYRDVEALSAAGVPIYAERGSQGGIALHEGWRTRLTGLTRGEADALPLLGLAAVARDLGLAEDAMAVQLKLMACLPADAGARVQRMASRVHVDPLPWYHRTESPACLPALAEAVWRERRIQIQYESWSGIRGHALAPLGLVLKGGLWYLVAQLETQLEPPDEATSSAPPPSPRSSRASSVSSASAKPAGAGSSRRPLRSYRVSAIRALTVLNAGFRRPRNFELGPHWAHSVADFEQRLMQDSACVRISEEGCRILRAVSPLAAEQVDASRQPCGREGWMQAQLPIETPEYSARQLLRLGAEVEVLAPPALRDALHREAGAILALYAPAPAETSPVTGTARRRARGGAQS